MLTLSPEIVNTLGLMLIMIFQSQVVVDGQQRVTPCSPGEPDAVEMTWEQVSTDELLEPIVDFKDFVKSVKSSRPTVSQEDLKRNSEWTQEFGSEGS